MDIDRYHPKNRKNFRTFSDTDLMIKLADDIEGFLTDLSLPVDHFRCHLVHLESGKTAVVSCQAVLHQAEEHVVRMEDLEKKNTDSEFLRY